MSIKGKLVYKGGPGSGHHGHGGRPGKRGGSLPGGSGGKGSGSFDEQAFEKTVLAAGFVEEGTRAAKGQTKDYRKDGPKGRRAHIVATLDTGKVDALLYNSKSWKAGYPISYATHSSVDAAISEIDTYLQTGNTPN